MTGQEMIENRRSIRKYKDEIISREVLVDLMETVKFTQSWCNFQVARYNFIQDPAKISEIMNDGVNGFGYNINTLKDAKNVMVLSVVEGKSGKLNPKSNEFSSDVGRVWEIFDAGIACQTFCLAAFEKGIGTCVMGVINSQKLKEIAELPQEETVAALITFGYPDEEGNPTTRKSIEQLVRFK